MNPDGVRSQGIRPYRREEAILLSDLGADGVDEVDLLGHVRSSATISSMARLATISSAPSEARTSFGGEAGAIGAKALSGRTLRDRVNFGLAGQVMCS